MLLQEHFKKEKDEKVKREESHHSKREGRRRGSMKKQEKHEEKQADTPVSNSAETQPSKFDNVEDVPTNFAETWRDVLSPCCGMFLVCGPCTDGSDGHWYDCAPIFVTVRSVTFS